VKVRAAHLFALASVFLLAACADSKEVNAAFSRTRVSWAVFDADQPDGLRPLAGFEQPLKVAWVPRNRALVATDLVPAPGGGAVAVSRLGLLVLDDSTGSLKALRPGAQWPLGFYETDRVFPWKGRLFITLRQEPSAEAPPASLAWWMPGQTRLAFYPVPSQVKDPTRQAVAVEPPTVGHPALGLFWKRPQGEGWVYEATSLVLDTGDETPGPPGAVPDTESPAGPGAGFAAERVRLTERLGEGVLMRAALGSGPPLVFTEAGWVAVGRPGEGARLYRLPELGPWGRYTAAVGLSHGFVFTWETSFRGYAGAAGLVHIPFAVLAP